MRTFLMSAAVVIAVCTGGCNSPKSPDAVANGVAAAEDKAASAVADAQHDAVKDISGAQAKVDDNTQALAETTAKGAYDVAAAKADGDQKVALEKCNALSGDAQTACKDQVDAKHDLAVANAKAALAAKKSSM